MGDAVTAATEQAGEPDAVSPPGSGWWSAMSPRMRSATLAGSVGGFLALAVWSVVSTLTRPTYDRLADLHVYLGAVRAVRVGVPLYSYAAENGDPFTYP